MKTITQNGVEFELTREEGNVNDGLGREFARVSSIHHPGFGFLVRIVKPGDAPEMLDVRKVNRSDFFIARQTRGPGVFDYVWPDRTYQQNSDTIIAQALDTLVNGKSA